MKALTAKFVDTAKYETLASKGEKNAGTLLPNRHADGGSGMYLCVLPSSARSFRYDYRFPRGAAGKRKTITYGTYPDVSLADARELHQQAKKELAGDLDPMELRRKKQDELQRKSDNTFKTVATEWFNGLSPHRSEAWRSSRWLWLDREFFPVIGSRPIEEVTAPDLLGILEGMVKRGIANSAGTARAVVAEVFDHAIAAGVAREGFNPAASIRKRIVVPGTTHHPKLEASALPEFMRRIEEYRGKKAPSIKIGLKLIVRLLVRRMELLGSRWAEMDLEAAQWRIPEARMKNRKLHIVPLSRQAVELFRELKAMAGDSEFCFPSPDSKRKPLSKSALNYALNIMGYEGVISPHGLRATAATVLSECGWDSEVIDLQLSHVLKNKIRAAYIRNPRLEERARLMQFWSDHLDALASGAKVIPINAGKAA